MTKQPAPSFPQEGPNRYKRVLLKVSGSAVAGSEGFGVSSEALDHITDQILAVWKLGVEVAVVIGGGNIFRGNVAAEWGIDRVEADQIGMLGTVINSLFLRGALNNKSDADVRVMSALSMMNLAEPYIRLRAIHHLEKDAIVVLACGVGQPFVTTDYACVQRSIEVRADAILLAKHGVDGIYDSDPNKNPSAKRYATLAYDDAISRDLKVMDQTALILARDYGVALHLFNFEDDGAMVRICKGINVGTYLDSNTTLHEAS